VSIVLRAVVCVCLDIRIWSGQKKLSPADLQIPASELPPQELATLGSKRLCDPGALEALHRIASRARECCQKSGVRFLSGFALPKGKAPEILNQLGELQKAFGYEKDRFLSLYEETVGSWVATHPEWAHLLRSVVPKEQVESKIGFDFQAFAVSEPIFADETEDEATSSSVANGLLKSTHQLPETLFAEVAQMARDAWRQSFEGKTTVTHKALRPLRAVLTKLELMKFLAAAEIQPLIDRIQQKLTELPRKGPILQERIWRLCPVLFIRSAVWKG
jgi:hypothetical protein